jgi:hypothetical protein
MTGEICLMRYVAPFEKLKHSFQISTVRGEVQVSATYDEFVSAIKLILQAIEVDEAWYMQHYPDVASAISEGKFRSAKHHFIENGYFEGRLPYEPRIDETWYLKAYPDVAESVQRGEIPSALTHFIKDGYREGRRPQAG